MQTDEETDDEIALVPYQITNFLVQEQLNAELAARTSTRQVTDSDRGVDPFLGNPLASAWYRDHPEDLDNDTRSSDEVGGHCLVCFAIMVLKCRRARMVYPRFQDKEAVHERGSPPLGYRRQ